MKKRCSKCNKLKKLNLFNIAKTSRFKFGRTPWCKICAKEYTKKYTEAHKEERRQYNKKYKQRNKERLSVYNRKYLKKYYRINREKLLKQTYAYTVNRSRSDICFRLARNLRRRLHHALRGENKSKTTLDLLGCRLDELKTHLQNKFAPGMSWDNYGKEWHIDHIVPMALFDLNKAEDIEKCCNYKNLQPLFCKDNLSKGKALKVRTRG